MTPQSVPFLDDEGDGTAEAMVEGDTGEEMTVANVVGAGDDGAGRATFAFTFTALATSSFSETVLDGLAADVDGVDGGSGAADELGAGAGDGDEGEELPLHKSASFVE